MDNNRNFMWDNLSASKGNWNPPLTTGESEKLGTKDKKLEDENTESSNS